VQRITVLAVLHCCHEANFFGSIERLAGDGLLVKPAPQFDSIAEALVVAQILRSFCDSLLDSTGIGGLNGGA
jgi:hypothetical protein